MFDLERSIAGWRKQMLAAGIQAPAPLDELELHLREEIEAQLKSDTAAQQAFEIAVKKIGHGPELRTEFKKTGVPMALTVVRLVALAYVLVACFFFTMILPRLFHHAMGFTPKLLGLAAVAVVLVSWRYNHRILPVVRSRWTRTVLGGVGCLAAVIGMQLFCRSVVPDLLGRSAVSGESLGWFLALFVWGWSLFAILGTLVYGLEKAAHQHETRYV